MEGDLKSALPPEVKSSGIEPSSRARPQAGIVTIDLCLSSDEEEEPKDKSIGSPTRKRKKSSSSSRISMGSTADTAISLLPATPPQRPGPPPSGGFSENDPIVFSDEEGSNSEQKESDAAAPDPADVQQSQQYSPTREAAAETTDGKANTDKAPQGKPDADRISAAKSNSSQAEDTTSMQPVKGEKQAENSSTAKKYSPLPQPATDPISIHDSDSEDESPGPPLAKKRQLTTRKPITPTRQSGNELTKDGCTARKPPARIQPDDSASTILQIKPAGGQETNQAIQSTVSKSSTRSAQSESKGSPQLAASKLASPRVTSNSPDGSQDTATLQNAKPVEQEVMQAAQCTVSKFSTQSARSESPQPCPSSTSPDACPTEQRNSKLQNGSKRSPQLAFAKPPPKPASPRATNNSRNGSHLAPIFASALARGQTLDVRNVIPIEIQCRKERLLRAHNAGSSNIATMEEEQLQPDARDDGHPCFSVKSVREPLPTKSRKRQREIEIPPHLLAMEQSSSDAIDPPIPSSSFQKPNGKFDIMHKIKHLSSTCIDERTGLPVHKFSVFRESDELVYDFEVACRTSTIPNSGNGAFLTFLGARELKPSIQKRHNDILKKRKLREGAIIDPLTARFFDGSHASVTVAGDHLNSAYNCAYLVPDSVDATNAAKPDFDSYYSKEEIAGLRNPSNRIGNLLVNKERDYIPAPNRTFSTLHEACGLIDLGRYGPFRKSDRKSTTLFDIKSFIFSQEPGEWGFGVSERIDGEEQTVDITDDISGKPSEHAKQNIPMYVNEVGHDKNLKHTVHALEQDDRTINYFLRVDTPLKRGDTIELFVDYFETYEQVRVRKGYGLANLRGTEKGDEDPLRRMQRNFQERDEIKHIMSDMELMNLHTVLEWVDSLHEKLTDLVQAFVNETLKFNSVPKDHPSALQVVALRRICWISGVFLDRLSVLKREYKPNPMDDFDLTEQLIDHCSNTCATLRRFSCSSLDDVFSSYPNLEDKDGINMRDFFQTEIVEEFCYGVRDIVKRPLNGSVWCNIAKDLTRRLCLTTASTLWRDDLERSQKTTILLQFYQSEALRAARLVASKKSPGDLAFDYEFVRDCWNDRANIGGVSVEQPSCAVGSKVIVQKIDIPMAATHEELHQQGKPMEIGLADISKLHDNWYLCWQVILVIHAFASKYLKASSYFLVDLCSSLTVDEKTAFSVIQKGITTREIESITSPRRKRTKPSPRHQKQSKPKKENKKTSNPKNGTAPTQNKSLFWQIVWVCLRDKFGWTMEHGNRPNDFYACPPGVSRGCGFKPRVDFFDSTSQILAVLREGTYWAEQEEIQACLHEYYTCNALYQKKKGTQALKQFNGNVEDMCNWLRNEAKKLQHQQ